MNLNFDAFTYITGIASLLGLVLQIKDSFPEHRDLRRSTVLLIIGIFVGSMITSLKGIKVDFGASISSFEILVGVFVTVLALVAITGAFTSDSMRRDELFRFSGIGTVALFILLMFGGISDTDNIRAERERKKVNVEELLELSSINASRGNYERALLFLNEAKLQIPQSDERRKVLEERIHVLKGKQVSRSREQGIKGPE